MENLATNLNNHNLSRSPRLPNKRIASIFRIGLIFLIPIVLISSLIRVDRTLGFSEYVFIIMAFIMFLAESFWLVAPYLKCMLEKPESTGGVHLYTPSYWFYEKHRQIRLVLQFGIISASLFVTVDLAQQTSLFSGILLMSFFAYSLVYLAWFVSVLILHFNMGHRKLFWLAVTVFIGAIIGHSIFILQRDLILSFLITIFGASTAFIIYLAQRISVDEQVRAEVTRELMTQFMNVKEIGLDYDKIVRRIGLRLGYERVFLLLFDQGKNVLKVKSEFGDYPSVLGREFPSDIGITGHAFASGEVIAWNNIKKCEYYACLIDKSSDTTRSEMAFPVRYRGRTYGVLDIQSPHPMVYGPGDIRYLSVIAQILGAAMAVRETDILLDNTNRLWGHLAGEVHSDQEIFQILANFAVTELKADVVTYYRLSPTGMPIAKPEIVGNLINEDSMLDPVFDVDSPLFKLIHNWKPYFDENLVAGSIFFHGEANFTPGFAVREMMRSVVFIPIGTPDERLAVVFLNYRTPQTFDSLFQMTILGFSQAFATVLARERYRELVFEGLGRPELGVHNIMARYGLKDGVVSRGRDILHSDTSATSAAARSQLFDMLREVDLCLIEIRAQNSKVEPSWNRTLRESVEDFTRKMKEHVPIDRPVRFTKIIDPVIERESPWTRLAIFRVIDEATNNAIFHGEAWDIRIEVARKENSINIKITNNGKALPEDAFSRRSHSGIFSILDELKEQFHANASVSPLPDRDGTKVKISIPALPYLKKENEL